MEYRDQSTTSRQFGFRITDMIAAKLEQGVEDGANLRGIFKIPTPNGADGLRWQVTVVVFIIFSSPAAPGSN